MTTTDYIQISLSHKPVLESPEMQQNKNRIRPDGTLVLFIAADGTKPDVCLSVVENWRKECALTLNHSLRLKLARSHTRLMSQKIPRKCKTGQQRVGHMLLPNCMFLVQTNPVS